MNFYIELEKGKLGDNKGLPFGDGFNKLTQLIGGVHKAKTYVIAAAPKVGKTTFIDYSFILSPFEFCMNNNIDIEWVYYSYEVDRITKEFDFCSYFLYKEGIRTAYLTKEGQTKMGAKEIPISSEYLRCRILDDNDKPIIISEYIEQKVKEIHKNKVVPLLGAYDEKGNCIKEGLIRFVESRNNPTGIYKELKEKAMREGRIIYEENKDNTDRIKTYIPNNPKKYTIVITDHLRKLIPEREYGVKQLIDKYLSYCVDLKKWFGYTFVHVIHINRELSSMDRLRTFNDKLHPTSDDIKDSGNPAEDADYLLTLFNPNDDKYNLKRHFGTQLRNDQNKKLYPNLRTIHLVESRWTHSPLHFRANMLGEHKAFEFFDESVQ